jgi:hypothetical protein
MKKIVIGCVYGGHKGLGKALLKHLKGGQVFSLEDLTGIDLKNVYFKGKRHSIKSFTSSFIRYPYDLIPPHTHSYEQRERTELFKSAAAAFSGIAINSLEKGFIARIRTFSLGAAERCGLEVPRTMAISESVVSKQFKNGLISKSLGNCFYAYELKKGSKLHKKFLAYEKDGNESAWIYAPHLIKDSKDLKSHLKTFGTILLQEIIKGKEYRVYIVGNKIFSYRRGVNPRLDKSFSELLDTPYSFTDKEQKKLFQLVKTLCLPYLCLDIIVSKKKLYVIDVNPFGSLPDYKKLPAATDALARMLTDS